MMKLKYALIATCVSTFALGCNSTFFTKNKETSYFDQTPVGMTPQIFAPGIVSTEQRDLSLFFSPDMQQMYFTRKDKAANRWSLHSYNRKEGEWKLASIEPRIGRPFIAPDGKTMHLGKRYKLKTSNGWSEVNNLGGAFDNIRIMRLTSSLNGTYVLDEGTRDGKGPIRYSRIVDGKREQPKVFGKQINTGTWNAHPFIAPDESYIMWDGERETGFGDNDIYISFKQPDGSWGEAINMGDKINSSASESSPYVTPDGKFLFFNSYRSGGQGDGDVYWVSAKVIEELRPH